jgi:hypothetical protein
LQPGRPDWEPARRRLLGVPLLASGRTADAATLPGEPDHAASAGAARHHELFDAAAAPAGAESPAARSR